MQDVVWVQFRLAPQVLCRGVLAKTACRGGGGVVMW